MQSRVEVSGLLCGAVRDDRHRRLSVVHGRVLFVPSGVQVCRLPVRGLGTALQVFAVRTAKLVAMCHACCAGRMSTARLL